MAAGRNHTFSKEDSNINLVREKKHTFPPPSLSKQQIILDISESVQTKSLIVAILSRSHGVIYPLPTSVNQNGTKR